MSETWKRWEGQVVNGALPLLRYLGGSDHSAVFLTERVGGAPKKAAIKLIRAEGAGAEDQLLRWKQSGKLTHPGLIRLFESGRCELEGTPLLYVVMECAEEDLSQILPERTLTPGEAQEMLPPVIKALSHIHAGGFVHGQVKPSNIMATGDQVKLSSDTLRAVDETVSRKRQLSVYDAPEASSGKLSPAADVWALGVTLVEVLTQRPPVWNRAQAVPPALLEGMPEPFREIAHHCLQVDAKQRWTLAQVTGRLKPEQDVAKKAAAPASVVGESKARAKWPIAVGVAVVLVIAAAVLIPKGDSKRSTSSPALPAEVQSQQPPAASSAPSEPSRKQREPKPSPAARGKTSSAQSGTGAAQGPVTKGAVAQQVMPRVSPSARNTIEGKIRVRVRVKVDPSGKVTEARLESAGPSKYFARLALEASRQWMFTPAQVQGRLVASEWILRYGFRRSDTEVVPEQVSP